MNLRLGLHAPLVGGLALLLCACPGGDDEGTTDANASTSTAGTTEDPGNTSSPASDSTGAPPPDTSTTGDVTAPDETTAADDTSTGAAGTGNVVMETSLGTIVIDLDEEAAPITSANFIAYVEAGFYDGTDGMGATTFHRVVPGFVIQGGGLTETLVTKPTMPPIANESSNGLSNLRGTLSMARTNDPDSATSQFFVNLVDNGFLDDPPGYAVFGEVVEGMDVVDAIAAVETADMGMYQDVPVVPVIILSATVQ